MGKTETVTLPAAELAVLLERAAEAGSRKALAAVGLHDDGAAGDVRDLRGLLDVWRDVKKTAVRTAVKTATALLLGAIAAAAGVYHFRD